MDALENFLSFCQRNPNLTISFICVTFFLLVLATCYYITKLVQTPVVICGQDGLKKLLTSQCPSLSRKIWHSPFCLIGGIHTVIAYYIKTLIPDIKYKREILKMSDGGQVSLDWVGNEMPDNNPNTPIILVLPGLNGDSQICYVKSIVVQAQYLGYRCVVFNNRGRGGVTLLTPKTYSATCPQDLDYVIRHIKKRFPNTDLLAVGMSLGGIILGQYLNKMADRRDLQGAVLFSTVFDAATGVKSIEKQPINTIINRFLAHDLVTLLKKYKHMFTQPDLNMDLILKSKSLREFDTNFMSKIWGFKRIDDYYEAASIKSKLKKISVPTLAINAADDPFQPALSLPTAEDIEGAPVAVVVTNMGGHLGFLEGLSVWKPSFADLLFREFCTAIFHNSNLKNEFLENNNVIETK